MSSMYTFKGSRLGASGGSSVEASANSMVNFSEGKTNWMDSLSSELQMSIGACHTLSLLDHKGRKELLGNQVELKMFEASGYEMASSSTFTSSNPKHHVKQIEVVRRMAFSQDSQTSGVVVRLPSDKQQVLVKGSFEKMAGLSVGGLSGSLHELVAELSKDQFYIITIGTKQIGGKIDVHKLPREELESDLELVGLLLFRNDLKEDSAKAIFDLKQGATRVVMITGDSVEAGLKKIF